MSHLLDILTVAIAAIHAFRAGATTTAVIAKRLPIRLAGKAHAGALVGIVADINIVGIEPTTKTGIPLAVITLIASPATWHSDVHHVGTICRCTVV